MIKLEELMNLPIYIVKDSTCIWDSTFDDKEVLTELKELKVKAIEIHVDDDYNEIPKQEEIESTKKKDTESKKEKYDPVYEAYKLLLDNQNDSENESFECIQDVLGFLGEALDTNSFKEDDYLFVVIDNIVYCLLLDKRQTVLYYDYDTDLWKHYKDISDARIQVIRELRKIQKLDKDVLKMLIFEK